LVIHDNKALVVGAYHDVYDTNDYAPAADDYSLANESEVSRWMIAIEADGPNPILALCSSEKL